MTANEARHFLHTCNDQIEAGATPTLRRRIAQARDIAADLRAKREAQAAAFRAALAARRVA
jgi:hypothetical protein